MMKLTVIVLFGLIGIAIALHGTGAYGNNAGGYGNNGGGGKKHHKSSESSSSSESEEAILPLPKVCKYSCTTNPIITVRSSPDATYDCNLNANNLANCQNCCEHFALEKGADRDSVVANDIGVSGKACNCCMRKCT